MALAFLLGLTLLALYFCYLLVAPFLKAILFALIFAVAFYPAHRKVRVWVSNRNIAAALSTSGIVLVVGTLSFFVGRALVSGLHDVYDSLAGPSDGREHLSVFLIQVFDRVLAWASGYVPISVPNLKSAALNQIESAVANLLGAAAGFLRSMSALGLTTFVVVFVLFFLLRDGRAMLRRLEVLLPLAYGQARRLFSTVNDTLHAIVFGTLAMAAIQGFLTGLAFWFLALTSPVVWGFLAAVLAVLPILGTTLVWLPASIMLVASGHWIKGLTLLCWGFAIVHPVDNIFRPYLIGIRIQLSAMYVFFAVIGGLKAFGALGLFLGPLILSITVALLKFLREEHKRTSHLPNSARQRERLDVISAGSNLPGFDRMRSGR